MLRDGSGSLGMDIHGTPWHHPLGKERVTEPASFAAGVPVLGDEHPKIVCRPLTARGCSQHHSQLLRLKHFFSGGVSPHQGHVPREWLGKQDEPWAVTPGSCLNWASSNLNWVKHH